MDADHVPGMPSSPDAPPELLRAVDSLAHPNLSNVGLTTTRDGRWALLARVKRGGSAPIAEVEAAAGGHPVVYEPEPDELPVARPAYPLLGE